MENLKNKRTKRERVRARILKKQNPHEQIAKSKQLMRKKSTIPKKRVSRSTNRNPEPNRNNICLLPSLADLEKLFEESECDICETTPSCPYNTNPEKNEDVQNFEKNATTASDTSNEINCSSKKNQIITIECEETLAPLKIKLDCNEKICIDCEPDYSSDDPSLKIPKKKLKIIEEEQPKSCDDNSNVTKLQFETPDDSDTTVAYDIDSPGRFSPLPSTSRDSDTILKNDIRFNASLISHESPKKSIESSIMIEAPKQDLLVEPPLETIVIDDEDDYPMIVCTNEQIYKKILPSPVVTDDEYSTLPMNEEVPINISDINIDDIIAENTNILKKYSDKTSLTVTEVPPVQNKNHTNSSPDITEAIIHEPGNNEATDLSALQIRSQPSNHNNIINEPRIIDEPAVLPDIEIQSYNHSVNEFGSVINVLQRVFNENENLNNRSHRKRKRKQTRTENRTCIPSIEAVEHNNLSTRSEITNTNTTTLATRNINAGRSINNTMIAETTPTPVRNIGDCPICLDPLATKIISSTICGHIFCMDCIKRAAKTSKRCPTCRKMLKSNGYHQIYF